MNNRYYNNCGIYQWISIIFYAWVLMVTGCTEKREVSVADIHYDLSTANKGYLSDVFSSVELIPLLFDGDNYPSQASEFRVEDDYIFVTDPNDRIFVFEKEGHYISSSVEKMGEGPEEHIFPMGYSYNRYTGNIEILTISKMMCYDVQFDFVKSSDLPTHWADHRKNSCFFNNVCDLSASTHMLMPSGLSDNPYRLIFFDSEKVKTGKELSYADDMVNGGQMQNKFFFYMPDSTILCVPNALTHSIYSFSKDDLALKKIISFSVGGRELTQEYIDNLNMEGDKLGHYLNSCDREVLLRILPAPNHIVTMLKHGNSLRDTYSVFTNRSTNEMISVNIYEDGKRISPVFGDITDGYAYAIADKEAIMQMPEILLDKKGTMDSIMNDIEDETLILLKYRFK